MLDWREVQLEAGLNFAVLGKSVERSLSPAIHTAALRSAHLEGSYRAISVHESELRECVLRLKEIGFRGVNVTVPHKSAAAFLADEPSEMVRWIGAANTLTFYDRVVADNTDVEGFFKPIATEPVGEALVLGAGGAGAAAAAALTVSGWRTKIWNRTGTAAEELVLKLRNGAVAVCDLKEHGCRLVVKAFSGENEAIATAISAMDEGGLFYDIDYLNPSADLLKCGSSKSIRYIDGREMLVAQAALSFKIWTGVEADIDTMRKAASLD